MKEDRPRVPLFSDKGVESVCIAFTISMVGFCIASVIIGGCAVNGHYKAKAAQYGAVRDFGAAGETWEVIVDGKRVGGKR